MLYENDNAIRAVRLYPEAPADSPAAAMMLHVAYPRGERDKHKALAYAFDRVMARARAARRQAQAEFPRIHTCEACGGEGRIPVDGEPTKCLPCDGLGKVSDYPGCHDDAWIAPELAPELRRICLELVALVVRKVDGIPVDGATAEDWSTPARIVELLEHTRHLDAAFLRVLRSQSPEKQEVFSSGS